MEYYKIHSLYKREGWYFDQGKKESQDYINGRQSFIFGDYAEPEFECIKNWRVTEKIDGTNIRIEYSKFEHEDGYEIEDLEIKGRTDNAQIPPHLLKYLQATFTKEAMAKQFPDSRRVVLFGEGYGPKIQSCGSLYASKPGFVLFDVVVGNWVLKVDDVKLVAISMGIPHVPDLGVMTTDRILEYVKSQPISVFSLHKQVMEGVVCTPEPVMLYRKGGPIKMKLKVKDLL